MRLKSHDTARAGPWSSGLDSVTLPPTGATLSSALGSAEREADTVQSSLLTGKISQQSTCVCVCVSVCTGQCCCDTEHRDEYVRDNVLSTGH